MDFSSAEAFGAEAAVMLDNIAGLGANVVLAQVRPFGDALYPSALYPFSHLATGTQGADPGFDPLAILVEQAHARGLELEAWVNPLPPAGRRHARGAGRDKPCQHPPRLGQARRRRAVP